MPLMDEFKEERAKIKEAPLKEKIKYYGYYYRWHAIVVISVIVLLSVWIHDVVSSKESMFFAAFVNSVSLQQDNNMEEDFASYAGIDTGTYDVLIDNTISIDPNATDEMSVSSSQRMMAYTAAGELDVIVGSDDIFSGYAYNDMFHDLRDILSEEQIKTYEPYFYYIDRTVVETINANSSDLDFVMPALPAPTKPEEMEDPVPVAIIVNDFSRLNDSYYFNGDVTALGVMVNSEHTEYAVSFIDYLFGENR